MELNIITTLISIAIAISTFFIGRQTNAKESGEREGKFENALETIGNDVKEIKKTVSVQGERVSKVLTDIEVLKSKVSTLEDDNKSIRNKMESCKK